MFAMVMLNGCSVNCSSDLNITMSEDGKGTFSTEIKIDKEFFEKEEYWKINGIDEYVEKMKAETDKDVSLNYNIHEFEDCQNIILKHIIGIEKY